MTIDTTPIRAIPHYELEGRILFTKARFRDAAAALIKLPDSPLGMVPMNYRGPRSKNIRYHWLGSVCSNTHYKFWTQHTRARVLDGSHFDRIARPEQCQSCRAEFLAS